MKFSSLTFCLGCLMGSLFTGFLVYDMNRPAPIYTAKPYVLVEDGDYSCRLILERG